MRIILICSYVFISIPMAFLFWSNERPFIIDIIYIYNCIILYWDYVLYPRGGGQVYPDPHSVTEWIPPVLTPFLSLLFRSTCRLRPYALGWLRGFRAEWGLLTVLGYIGALTWRGWSRRRLSATGAGHLFCATEPWTPGCTGVWPAPKLWQSYYWLIRTSSRRVDGTLLQGNWLYFSGCPFPPPQASCQQRQRRERSVNVVGGKSTDTSSSLLASILVDTFPVSSPNGTWHLC